MFNLNFSYIESDSSIYFRSNGNTIAVLSKIILLRGCLERGLITCILLKVKSARHVISAAVTTTSCAGDNHLFVLLPDYVVKTYQKRTDTTVLLAMSDESTQSFTFSDKKTEDLLAFMKSNPKKNQLTIQRKKLPKRKATNRRYTEVRGRQKKSKTVKSQNGLETKSKRNTSQITDKLSTIQEENNDDLHDSNGVSQALLDDNGPSAQVLKIDSLINQVDDKHGYVLNKSSETLSQLERDMEEESLEDLPESSGLKNKGEDNKQPKLLRCTDATNNKIGNRIKKKEECDTDNSEQGIDVSSIVDETEMPPITKKYVIRDEKSIDMSEEQSDVDEDADNNSFHNGYGGNNSDGPVTSNGESNLMSHKGDIKYKSKVEKALLEPEIFKMDEKLKIIFNGNRYQGKERSQKYSMLKRDVQFIKTEYCRLHEYAKQMWIDREVLRKRTIELDIDVHDEIKKQHRHQYYLNIRQITRESVVKPMVNLVLFPCAKVRNFLFLELLFCNRLIICQFT